MSFHISKIHFDIFIHSYAPVHSNRFPYAHYFPVDLVDLLFNQEKKIYNSTLADLETSYHLLTSIYYKNALNLTMSLVTKYYP